MPVFVEDPAQFSKPRLKSELIAHNVTLPAAENKKQVYVELYLKHISQKNVADFSSDEEDDQQDVVEIQDSQDCEEENKEDPEMTDPCGLTDDELKATLLKYGVEAGPIVATTRSIYERKLQRLLEPAQPRQNGGTGDADQYSDSEEGEEEWGSEQGRPETVSLVEEYQHANEQMERHSLNNKKAEYHYHQCFMPSSRMWVWRVPGRYEFNPKRNAGNHGNVAESSITAEGGHRGQLPPSPVTPGHGVGLSRTSSLLGHTTGSVVQPPSVSLGGGRDDSSYSSSQSFSITEMIESRSPLSSSRTQKHNGSNIPGPWPRPHREPVTDVLMEMFPETEPTRTGIAATRRRPIKGAAGRPVQFKYPDFPASPMTLQRQAVECRLVPLWVQILVFLILTCLLYLIYAAMEHSSDHPFVALLDNLSMGMETEGLSLQADP
ncbi:lamina-associated polypeptide 2 isoform X2 [Coregonus clupeaformis]|uniref:lamina-associated polypeptide 2 isoform X2 n=1 Tax=Coregonus clupeaformis TaxID=59861 RepID=UPI001BE085F0|nr:lamina-associated polypeptide 2 isoform X2 [Coregonus clupeaformis]